MGILADWAGIFANLSQILLLFLGLFLILIVLLQRGRGGGLAGAFGGAGGQSAFGTKAGDVFTKITVGVAVFWVIMNGVSGFFIRQSQTSLSRSEFGDTDPRELISPPRGESDIPLAPADASTGGTSGGQTSPRTNLDLIPPLPQDSQSQVPAGSEGSAGTPVPSAESGEETTGESPVEEGTSPAESDSESTEPSPSDSGALPEETSAPDEPETADSDENTSSS